MSELRKDSNVLYTCEDCGDEVYFRIKNNEQVPNNFIYCYFPPITLKDGTELREKMWVKIKGGDRTEGWGFVENKSVHPNQIKLGESLHFKTDEQDVTRIVGH